MDFGSDCISHRILKTSRQDLSGSLCGPHVDENIAENGDTDKKAVDEALGGLGLLTKSDMENMISKLENKLLGCIKKEVNKAAKPLEARVEDQQGSETGYQCVEKVKNLLESLKIEVSPDCIDRDHRIGRVKTSKDGKIQSQAMIIKINSWDSRMAVYKARKEQRKVKIFMDLTRKRAKLFSNATDKAKSNPNIEFAFADINCRLGFKVQDGSFKFFTT
eukprot:gene4575-20841_t